MGFLDLLGSIAVASIDSALKNDNFVMGVALSENGEKKLDNLMNSRESISRTMQNRRYRQMYDNGKNNRKNNTKTESTTGKNMAIGLGVLAVAGIGAAILSSSSDEKNKSDNKIATLNIGKKGGDMDVNN